MSWLLLNALEGKGSKKTVNEIDGGQEWYIDNGIKNIGINGKTENDDAFLIDFEGFLKCWDQNFWAEWLSCIIIV